MHTLLYFLGLAAGIAVLVKSADWFTGAAVALARRLRVPEVLVGATIVSLATTLPEFAVSFMAAWRGKVDVAVGNAVGSTICNVGLILGLCALLSPMGVARRGFVNSAVALLVLSLVFALLGMLFPDGSVWVGVVMLTGLALYLAAAVRSGLAARSEVADSESDMGPRRIGLLFAVGAVGVVLASKAVVFSAEALARSAGISSLVISLTLVALGTSMPELVVSVTAIVKKRRGLSIGNIVGANILNLAWVLGACSIVADLPLRHQTVVLDIPVMLLLSVLLLVFGVSGQRLSRWEGAVMFAIYVAYITTVFTFAF